MQIMLKQTSPKAMKKELQSKTKLFGKKEICEKKLLKKEEKPSAPSSRLNPVVILDRLPANYASTKASRTSSKKKGKSSKSRGGEKNTTNNWQWWDGDEEWSNDGSVSEVDSSFNNRLAAAELEEGGQRRPGDEPEVDVIDGVKFLSFSHEPREFSRFHSFYHPFFSDCDSENSLEESLSNDFKQKIIPTKTRDITLIKGWRKKLFGNCNEYGMPSEQEGRENAATSPDVAMEEDGDNRSIKDLYESDHDNLDYFDPAPGTCDEGEIIFDDLDEQPVKEIETPTKNNLDDHTLRSHMELSKVESKAANVESAFQSKGLEEFLGQKSELKIGLLSQYDPNVKIIEKDSPILAVGTLKADDYVPPWKKMMERQRKRMELLAASRKHRKEESKVEKDTKKSEDRPKNNVQSESGHKIVWLDDDSESDEVQKQSEKVSQEKTRETSEVNKENAELVYESRDDDQPPQLEVINFKPHEIKKEIDLEESSPKNNNDSSIKSSPQDEGKNQITSPRAKRPKKLSWKMLKSLEMDQEELQEMCEERKPRNKHKNYTAPKVSIVEEPIKISLKHSPDRSSWIINNVVSEGDNCQQSKRRRKIRNYSYIFATEDGVFKDKLPAYEIVDKTVWSRSKILETELVQFLVDWRNPLVYIDALQRYECKTDLDEVFPDLTEQDALMAVSAVNRLDYIPSSAPSTDVTTVTERPVLYPKITSYSSEVKRKKISRFEQLQHSLRFMDVDTSLVPALDSNSNPASDNQTKIKSNNKKRKSGPEIEPLPLDDERDVDDPNFSGHIKKKKLTPEISEKDSEIVLDDSNSSDESRKKQREQIAVNGSSFQVMSSSDDTSRSQEAPQTLQPSTVANKSPDEKKSSPAKEVIELPSSPTTVEKPKSDEEVSVVFKKHHPKDPTKKRKTNRELQKTLILKSFRQVVSGNTVLKSFIVANTNIASKAKDNMSLGLCAVGLTLNKGTDVKNDIFLLYGRINDLIYNEAVKKSFHDEKLGIATHHTVVPIVLEITKAAMKSSNDLKLVRIPLKGRALIDNQLDSVPLMLYPVATKPLEQELVEVPSKSKDLEVAKNDVSIVKEVRHLGPEADPEKKKMKTSILRSKNTDDNEVEVDVMTRSDEESPPVTSDPPTVKKAKFVALNRTEPIRRVGEKIIHRTAPRTSTYSHLQKSPTPIFGTLAPNKSILTPLAKQLPKPASNKPTTPVMFSGTFGASRALATLKTMVSEDKIPPCSQSLSPKDKIPNGKKEEVSLINALLSDKNNGAKKDLKLLTTKQLSEISEIVDSIQPSEVVDPSCDHELRSAAEAAWQIVGPCIVRRVKLRNGNVVYVYKSCQAQQQQMRSPGLSLLSPREMNLVARHTTPITIAADSVPGQRLQQLVTSSQPKSELVNANAKTYSNPQRVNNPSSTSVSNNNKLTAVKIISPPIRGIPNNAVSLSEAMARNKPIRPKINAVFGSTDISSIPKMVVSPMQLHSAVPSPTKDDTSNPLQVKSPIPCPTKDAISNPVPVKSPIPCPTKDDNTNPIPVKSPIHCPTKDDNTNPIPVKSPIPSPTKDDTPVLKPPPPPYPVSLDNAAASKVSSPHTVLEKPLITSPPHPVVEKPIVVSPPPCVVFEKVSVKEKSPNTPIVKPQPPPTPAYTLTATNNPLTTKPIAMEVEEITIEDITPPIESKSDKNDIEIIEPQTLEPQIPPPPTKHDKNTSVWIGTDGEPCYVMRLDTNDDDDDDEDEVPVPKTNNSQSMTEEGSTFLTITECFPISEEEFQRTSTVSSNIVETIT